MYTKTCPKCYQPSFSSSKTGEWDCPICQTDLSNLRARDAGEVFPSVLYKTYPTPQQIELQQNCTFEIYI